MQRKVAIVRKISAVICAGCLSLMLVGCGPQQSSNAGEADAPAQGMESSAQPVAGTPEAILQTISDDFATTAQEVRSELDAVFSETGDTYDGYSANKQSLLDWYAYALGETEELNGRTIENAREYYRTIVATIGHSEDNEGLFDALDDLYDVVYEDAYEDYYDAVYEDAFELVYETYYEGVLDDAYDTVPYEEWFDARSECYEDWFDNRSELYEIWSDGRSEVYEERSDVSSAFWNDEYDIDEILRLDTATTAEVSASSAEPETTATEAPDADSGTADASGVSADFKATMDNYEAFFDEYVEFMKAYANGATPEMLGEYSDMMTRYSEYMTELSQVDTSQLSAADAAYFAEVQLRINQKLLEAA